MKAPSSSFVSETIAPTHFETRKCRTNTKLLQKQNSQAPGTDAQSSHTKNALSRWTKRLFPPMSKEQTDILASVKFPCC